MKKIKIFSVFLIIAVSAVLFFWQDLAGFYGNFSLKLPQIEKGVSDLVQEAEKQIFTPAPLRAEKEAQKSLLTQKGIILHTNAKRAQNGLPALKESLNLDASAEAKVLDMFKNQYFAHESPDGVGVGDLAGNAGYDFLIIGENLALGNFENDQALVQAWMDSPGHRANILNANYQEIGVFVQKGTFEGKITWLAVQHFGKPVSSCPQPDATLKIEIETSQDQLLEIQNILEILRIELKTISRRDRESYNQKVAEYNDFVSQYNNLSAEIKTVVVTYNEQVKAFNICAVGN
ncbi:MAG: CAP domain-containing protein [Parcubacteria group bacterium]